MVLLEIYIFIVSYFSSIDVESMVLNWTLFRKTVIYVFCAQNSIIASQYSVSHIDIFIEMYKNYK